jgi:fluoride exporter
MTGSFFMGILSANGWLSISVNLLVGTGFLGAYTTFSTMNFELFMLKKNKRHVLFILYLISSYCLGLLSAGMGYWIGKILFDR